MSRRNIIDCTRQKSNNSTDKCTGKAKTFATYTRTRVHTVSIKRSQRWKGRERKINGEQRATWLGREEEQGSNVGRRAGDHHQVKSFRNAPANNLKFKLRAGLQI